MLLFSFASCSSLMNSLYRDLDKGERKSRRSKSPRGPYDQFDQFRNGGKYSARRNNNRPISSSQAKNYLPSTKRKYHPGAEIKRRYRANDLNDNKNTESLWSGENKDDYLFTINKKKENGDIILVNILTRLKNEITMELKKAFKQKKKRRPPQKKGAKGTAAVTPPLAAPTPPKEKNASGGEHKVHDRISTVVMEEINKNHLLIRGQKFLLYKNKKRLVELQALIARKDINDDDAVDSSRILESNITILR